MVLFAVDAIASLLIHSVPISRPYCVYNPFAIISSLLRSQLYSRLGVFPFACELGVFPLTSLLCVCVCVCVCVFVCLCVCVWVCVFVCHECVLVCDECVS